MWRSRASWWLMRGERGSSSVEMGIALPIVLTVLFLAVQAGTWCHARSIAPASAQSGARTSAMLNLYVESQLVRRDLELWLAEQRKRMLAEDGMSETIQNVLWAIFAIAIVGIVAAIIQAYVVGKANEIR